MLTVYSSRIGEAKVHGPPKGEPSAVSFPPPQALAHLETLLLWNPHDTVLSVQFSCVQLFATPWITARQASLSITNSRSLLKFMSIESVMPSSHLILCRPLLFLPLGCFYLWDTKYVFIPSPGYLHFTYIFVIFLKLHFTRQYYSAIKRDESESVLVKWMNLEPVIQSEIRQKEKNKHSILTHIYGI